MVHCAVTVLGGGLRGVCEDGQCRNRAARPPGRFHHRVAAAAKVWSLRHTSLGAAIDDPVDPLLANLVRWPG